MREAQYNASEMVGTGTLGVVHDSSEFHRPTTKTARNKNFTKLSKSPDFAH